MIRKTPAVACKTICLLVVQTFKLVISYLQLFLVQSIQFNRKRGFAQVVQEIAANRDHKFGQLLK